jgi:hypothetical protein
LFSNCFLVSCRQSGKCYSLVVMVVMVVIVIVMKVVMMEVVIVMTVA